ncbi:MAG: sigma-54-dependent Fis family transcriptional regulator [Alphaproteobacteria bacterium]|nr:sigma-54-dependent Fis family transcriptional regulator [Alphaproteobacteria bacterium]
MIFEDSRLVAFVDDDDALREANVQALQLAGYDVRPFASAEAALKAIDADFAGVVVSDIRMPGMDGRQLFRRLHELDADLPVLLITGHGDIAEAVQAMHEGAYDFLAKPYPTERLVHGVSRAIEKRRLVLANRQLQALAAREEPASPLLGSSAIMERLRSTIRQVAGSDVDVLIEGETGVGKEVVARALHAASPRRRQPFVALNCAALPEAMIESELFGHELGAFSGAMRKRVGRIESADRGTLFLDEVESMPLPVQGKLLRVIEEREITPLGANEVRNVNLRVLASSKGDLGEAVGRGEFRADLFYRLNALRIRVPALRDRREDAPVLFGHFLAEAARRFRRETPAISDAVRRRLLEHDWPGNVRELNHFALQVALGFERPDGPEPARGAGEGSLPERVDTFEAQLIQDALTEVRGDVRAALEVLKIPRKTFYDKLRRHGIDIDAFRSGGKLVA